MTYSISVKGMFNSGLFVNSGNFIKVFFTDKALRQIVFRFYTHLLITFVA